MSELVSCIMPTRNRPAFVAQALRCFQSQTRLLSELILVDDGEESVASLCRGLDRVRCLRLDRRTPTGTKLNLGIDAARGDILQKLDDDDYYHPRFLDTAAAHLLGEGWNRKLAAWDSFLILLAGESRPRYSGTGWLAGGTLCFSRQLWRKAPFRDVHVNEDHWFLEDHKRGRVRVRLPEQYVLVRHGANTWVRLPDGTPTDGFLRQFPHYPKSLRRIVYTRSLAFYQGLAPPATAPEPTQPSRRSPSSLPR
jgi:glycosyltransferase involved in cell wall biosynthesis